MKKSAFLVLALAATLSSCSNKGTDTISPDGAISASLTTDSVASLTIKYHGADVIAPMQVGITVGNKAFEHGLRLLSVSDPQRITDQYTMLTGKRSHIDTEATERTYTLINEQDDTLRLICRAYNDGVAFRYALNLGITDTVAVNECTTLTIADGTNRWIQDYRPDSYEDFYPLATNGEASPRNRHHNWALPVLVEPTDGLFALVTEADITRDHCAYYLTNADDPTKYRFVGGTEMLAVDGEYLSPWRVVIVGGLDAIVESTLVTDVSTPAADADYSWIEPAPASWIYWAYNHGSKDYKTVVEYIDLAKAMNWPYVLIDWEWAEMVNGGDIYDALKYAQEQGVKPLLWYNSSTNWVGDGAPVPQYRLNSPEARAKEMHWLVDNGVAGIKVDFFPGDDVATMNYDIDLLEDGLKNNLLITLHGATIPRGWQRTYPNLMTVEGVYGAEWYNNAPVLTTRAAAHNATLPFTRNVVGPMDYTPGTFSDTQHKHITTFAHELALPILFESGVQHMPDRPDIYLEVLPDTVRTLLSALPSVWDDTRFVAGYPGDNAVLYREKGDKRYIAGINGTDEPKDFDIDIAKYGFEPREVLLISDGADSTRFDIRTLPTPARVKISTLPRGGFVIAQ